jgi:hypothetical protein
MISLTYKPKGDGSGAGSSGWRRPCGPGGPNPYECGAPLE